MKLKTVLELAAGIAALFIGLDLGAWLASKLKIG